MAVFLCLSAFRPPVFALLLLLSGKVVGGFFQPFHGFQFIPHGFHIKGVGLFLDGQAVNLTPPCFRRDFLAPPLSSFRYRAAAS